MEKFYFFKKNEFLLLHKKKRKKEKKEKEMRNGICCIDRRKVPLKIFMTEKHILHIHIKILI
jgi:hypothetical protein